MNQIKTKQRHQHTAADKQIETELMVREQFENEQDYRPNKKEVVKRELIYCVKRSREFCDGQ